MSAKLFELIADLKEQEALEFVDQNAKSVDINC